MKDLAVGCGYPLIGNLDVYVSVSVYLSICLSLFIHTQTHKCTLTNTLYEFINLKIDLRVVSRASSGQ